MMILRPAVLTVLLTVLGFSYAQSENFSTTKPIFCSVNQVHECIAWKGCNTVNPYVANIPYFLTVDLATNAITGGTTVDDHKSTKIERIEIIDELITLSGAEPESENGDDKFGWVMTISKNTGQMVLSANSNDSSFVIFGSCINK